MQVRHSVALQPPQSRVPPQPSETVPQVPEGQDVAGVQQAPLKTPPPGGQQRPNNALAFFMMGFAQFRLQQLMGVAHCWPFGLQRSARASHAALKISAVLATSARRAVRQNRFASSMGVVPPAVDAAAHWVLKSRVTS